MSDTAYYYNFSLYDFDNISRDDYKHPATFIRDTCKKAGAVLMYIEGRPMGDDFVFVTDIEVKHPYFTEYKGSIYGELKPEGA